MVKIFLFCLSLLTGFSFLHPSWSTKPAYRICMTQIVRHPSLDLIRQGIMDELKDQDLSVHVDFFSANGDVVQALQIAQHCVSLGPQAIVALTTPSAQAVKKALRNQAIPFVFSAITDPVGAGLVSDLQEVHPTQTGTVDAPDPREQLRFFKELMPNLTIIGALYNPSEANAHHQVQALVKAAHEQDIQVVCQPVTKLSDMNSAVALLGDKVQAFYIPNDNLMVSGLEIILKASKSFDRPVFASDPESVERGAHASFSNDQYKVGRRTGKLVARLLKNERNIPIDRVHEPMKSLGKAAFLPQ